MIRGVHPYHDPPWFPVDTSANAKSVQAFTWHLRTGNCIFALDKTGDEKWKAKECVRRQRSLFAEEDFLASRYGQYIRRVRLSFEVVSGTMG